MPFNNEYIEKIILITSNLRNNNIPIAETLFKDYIDIIEDIGPFKAIDWQEAWRKDVWEFGVEFKSRNPQKFLNIIDERLNSAKTKNKEVLEFIRSEIVFNFLSDSECKKQIEKLIETFPFNPEFRHSLGHFYSKEENYLLAIEEYKLALKIEPKNKSYLKSRFENENEYLNHLIKQGEYNTGQKYVENLFKEDFYRKTDIIYHNTFVGFATRFGDHFIFQDKIKKVEREFKDKMHEELYSERKRIIEILGFFSAVVAFILATVSIGKNFSFIEAIYFIAGLGIILILFVVSLTTLFSPSKASLFKDKKFWILVIALILLLLYIIEAPTISVAIQHLTNTSLLPH